MKKTYQKPAIDMEALESEQAIAAASIMLQSSSPSVNADEAAARVQTSSDESTSNFSVWDD